MTSKKSNSVAIAEMLIRKPVLEVFEAFINPDITTKFWFTKSSGRIEPGKNLVWTWEMFNHSSSVSVISIETNKTILLEWGDNDAKTKIEWTFNAHSENSTFISVINSGFTGDTDQIISQIRDSTEGFTLVLAGLKAYLEHSIQLNLILDRFPSEK
ncbi:MAG: SRPBCC family protein [Cyclobacteriaceae bacterium]